jgi:hypothetical protein
MPAKQKPRSLKPAKEGSSNVKEQVPRKRQPSGRISAACEACKKRYVARRQLTLAMLMGKIHRKTKCSGHPPPCQMCEQLDTPCVIDLTLDMRRRTALQRTMEESRAFQDALNGVIGILRSGDGAEIEGLIAHVQSTANEEDSLEALQNELQIRGKSESSTRKIKEEGYTTPNFGTDEEEEEMFNGDFSLTPGSARKRTFSMSGDDVSRPSINPLQPGSSDKQEGEYLASRYLPLISRLRTVSDLEATRILHKLSTSPVNTEGVASLNLLDRRYSRPNLNVQTNPYPRTSQSSGSTGFDRTNWHPSLQITKPDLQTPTITRSRWTEQSSDLNVIQVCLNTSHNIAFVVLPT